MLRLVLLLCFAPAIFKSLLNMLLWAASASPRRCNFLRVLLQVCPSLWLFAHLWHALFSFVLLRGSWNIFGNSFGAVSSSPSKMLRKTRFKRFCTEVPEGLPKCSLGTHLEQFPAPGTKMLRNTNFGSFCTKVPEGTHSEQFPVPGCKISRNTSFGAFCMASPRLCHFLLILLR